MPPDGFAFAHEMLLKSGHANIGEAPQIHLGVNVPDILDALHVFKPVPDDCVPNPGHTFVGGHPVKDFDVAFGKFLGDVQEKPVVADAASDVGGFHSSVSQSSGASSSSNAQ